MKKAIFAMALMLFGCSAFAQNADQMLNSYIVIKKALVKSDTKATSDAINDFYTLVNEGEDSALRTEVLKTAETLMKSTDLKGQRNAFKDFSISFWSFVKNAEKISQPVYYQYCPMAKGYWMSFEKKIENPYYGASMLSCGKVVETKE